MENSMGNFPDQPNYSNLAMELANWIQYRGHFQKNDGNTLFWKFWRLLNWFQLQKIIPLNETLPKVCDYTTFPSFGKRVRISQQLKMNHNQNTLNFHMASFQFFPLPGKESI